MIKRLFNDHGDTLIEVTLALAILTSVLTSAYVVATKMYSTGQAAKERDNNVNYAQQQAEALREFRDSRTWQEFLYGGMGSVPTPDGEKGIWNALSVSPDCVPDTPPGPGYDVNSIGNQACFKMYQDAANGNKWYPRPGAGYAPGSAGTYFVDIFASQLPNKATGVPGPLWLSGSAPNPPGLVFAVNYGAQANGGLISNGKYFKNSLKMELVNVDGLVH